MMNIYEAIGSAAACLTMFGFLPQVLKMFRTRSVRDVSLLAILQTWIGVFLWIAYGLYRNDMILTGANVVSFTIFSAALVLYLIYRKQDEQCNKKAPSGGELADLEVH